MVSYDAFALIADDLKLSPEQLFVTARQNPVNLKDEIQRSKIAKLPFILEEDLLVRGSKAPILARGMDLMKNIDAVFRILQLEQNFIRPPKIKPDTKLNNYLKNRISADLERISRKVRASKKLGALFQRAEKNKDVEYALKNLTVALNKYLSSPEVIAALWNSLRDSRGSSLMEDSVNTALIAMITTAAYFQVDRPLARPLRRAFITHIGLSALFQDISVLINGASEDDLRDHASRSAELAKNLDLPREFIAAIANHHRVTDYKGRPILESTRPALSERILVCITYFLLCVMRKNFDLSLAEAMYVMNHYARRLYFDRMVVLALGQMGVGGFKSRIISEAAELVQQCDYGYEPYLWDVNAAIPNRIICRHPSCRYLGKERVTLFRRVLFETPEHRFNIPEGEYRHCQKLTGQLGRRIVMIHKSGH